MTEEEHMNERLDGKYAVYDGVTCEEVIFNGVTRRQAMEQMQKHRYLKIQRIYKI